MNFCLLALGRISSETDLANDVKLRYTYDDLSRVIKRETISPANGETVVDTENFNYNPAGNMTIGMDESVVYDANNRIVEYRGTEVTYDADGNMLVSPVGEFTYDWANRLITADTYSYVYDVENIRTKKCVGETITEYTHNANSKLSQLLMKTENGVTTYYVYGRGLIGEEVNGAFKTYHFDYRGSTVAITDESGTKTDTFEYDTYGRLSSRTGTTNTQFLYNGRDGVMTDENGLVYMRARYYSPTFKRFINADVVAGSITNAITLNRYAYANGNPVSNVDPFGLFALVIMSDDFIGITANENTSFMTYDVANAIELAKSIGHSATIEDGTISISMDLNSDKFKQAAEIIGMKKTCDYIAEASCEEFYNEFGRAFILSDECVSKEILDHANAYYWSTGENFFANYLALGYLLMQMSKGSTYDDSRTAIYEATRSIDMREGDIKESDSGVIDYISSQAFLFKYKSGIREEYIGTQYDPWSDERK